MPEPAVTDATIQTLITWRADSITLARMRPHLTALMDVAMTERCTYGDACNMQPRPDERSPCLPCVLRYRMEAINMAVMLGMRERPT